MCVLMHIIKSDISVKEKLGIYIELQEFIFLLHNNGAKKLNPKKIHVRHLQIICQFYG